MNTPGRLIHAVLPLPEPGEIAPENIGVLTLNLYPTLYGGRLRRLSEWHHLYKEVGFQLV